MTVSPIIVEQPSYLSMKPSEIWDIVCKLAEKRFSYKFCPKFFEFELFRIPYQKLAALRDLCITIGLVLERK